MDVLVVGAGASAFDIIRQLRGVARKVIQSTRATTAPIAASSSMS